MRQSDSAVGFVNVLTASAAGTVSVLADILFFDVDIGAVGNLWRDIDGGEACLPFAF